MASARERVLGVPELLEAVLLQLFDGSDKGFATALLSTRVSRFFKTTIETSPALQRKLYFRQDKPKSVAGMNSDGYNKFFLTDKSTSFQPEPDSDFWKDDKPICTVHPHPEHPDECSVSFRFPCRNLPRRLENDWQVSSWEKMLLRDRNVRVTEVVVRYGFHAHEYEILWESCDVRSPTLGQLLRNTVAAEKPQLTLNGDWQLEIQRIMNGRCEDCLRKEKEACEEKMDATRCDFLYLLPHCS